MLRPMPLPADHVLRRSGPDSARVLPLLDRAFDAVERALADLGIEDPAELTSPQVVEEELSPAALPAGTLLVLDPEEVRSALEDIADTVLDERLGGSVFGTIQRPPAEDAARRRLREMSSQTAGFGFLPPGTAPYGVGRVRQVRTPAALGGYQFLAADTPGFRVALVERAMPNGKRIALWTGTPDLVDELLTALRRVARHDGHPVPGPAPLVPGRDAVSDAAEVWRQAGELRAHRTVREAELRQVARAAAMRGVELRRQREEGADPKNRAAS
jgi:hypothetical protein